ncbi:MAG: Exodeoxyribonuclease-3 [Hydrocarboniphaga sp.]|uniref:exodeoxyribonuclease III n=1 Tax=Hydrocarboniphaga sp. TaxID=2033016 RepID=UPI0026214872|nr:exodeoxyribonuclease III [Hydrocarboniphaga sp.]MDB5972968.1 Exodeoxyribonuclease-3 [Hydrocarboniphaga sp.]
MKIATWNVNSLRVRLPHLLDWLAANPVDALGIQESKLEDSAFPHADLAAAGWHAVSNGQKTYNGVAILARDPPADVVRDIPGFEDPQRRVIAATVGGVRVIDVYVVNGQAVGSEKYEYKLRWLTALQAYLKTELLRYPLLAVVGDYNIAPTDADVYDPVAWGEDVLCSPPEREALRSLIDLGLVDCVAQKLPEGNRFTWWDYRQAAFRRNMGLRIDHVLASTALAAKLSATVIDTAPRKLERPSDHAPVVAIFD